MGTAIQSSSNVSSSQTTSSTATWQQRNQDLQSLTKALQSGNLDQAKTAYAQVLKDSPASATQNPNSPLAQVGKALQNGDVAGAQKAMANAKTHHGGHHHKSSASSSSASTSTTPTVSNPTATLGNSVNTLA